MASGRLETRTRPRRSRPKRSHSASRPAPPASASHCHRSVASRSGAGNFGMPRRVSAGTSHLDSQSCGSVSEYTYSRSSANTRTVPGVPLKNSSARPRTVKGTGLPSSLTTRKLADRTSASSGAFTVPTLPVFNSQRRKTSGAIQRSRLANSSGVESS